MKYKKKGKQGQVVLFGLMWGLTIIILALALAPATSQFVEIARNATVEDTLGLDCATTTSNFILATCEISDLTSLYFIGTLLFIGGGVILAKIILD